MNRHSWLLGIFLAGALLQVASEPQAKGWDYDSNEGQENKTYLDDNQSTNANDPCQNVSPGPQGGTRDWEWKSDAQLRQAVECQLSQNPFIKSNGIDVSVEGGTAFLSGTVRDQDSIRSAIVDAYGAGVRDVVSKLEVQE